MSLTYIASWQDLLGDWGVCCEDILKSAGKSVNHWAFTALIAIIRELIPVNFICRNLLLNKLFNILLRCQGSVSAQLVCQRVMPLFSEGFGVIKEDFPDRESLMEFGIVMS